LIEAVDYYFSEKNKSIMLHDVLKKVGINVKLHILKGVGHGFELSGIDIMQVEDFFGKYVSLITP